MFFVLWIVKVVVRQPAPSSFEQQNTKQLSEVSLPPYFKSTKIFYIPLVWNVKSERQHHLSIVFQPLLPFSFKPTLILDNAMIISDNTISCKYPSDYSYQCSHLTATTHIATAPNHFHYRSFPLITKGPVIFRLSAQVLNNTFL